MKTLLNKIFPKSNPFGDDVWWEIALKQIYDIKCELEEIFCKKRLSQERAAYRAEKIAFRKMIDDKISAMKLRMKWEEEDKKSNTPKPRKIPMFVVNAVATPYYRVTSYYFLTFMQRYDELLYKIESNPELMAFIRENWENKDDFDMAVCLQEDGGWLSFPDDPLAQGFCDYLSYLKTRDNIAKELMARFIGAKHYPLSFLKQKISAR